MDSVNMTTVLMHIATSQKEKKKNCCTESEVAAIYYYTFLTNATFDWPKTILQKCICRFFSFLGGRAGFEGDAFDLLVDV